MFRVRIFCRLGQSIMSESKSAEIIFPFHGKQKVIRNGKFICYTQKLSPPFDGNHWAAFKGQRFAIGVSRKDAIEAMA